MTNVLNFSGVLNHFYDTYIEERESFNSMEYREAFFEIFNTGDYRLPYIYYSDAEAALKEADVFAVLDTVRAFYLDVYGIVDWNWADPCLLAGAYFQYLAEEYFIEGGSDTGEFFREIQNKICNEEDDEQLLALVEADLDYFNRGVYE